MQPVSRRLAVFATAMVGLLAAGGCVDRHLVGPSPSEAAPAERSAKEPVEADGASAGVENVRVRVLVSYEVSVIARTARRGVDLSDPRHFDVKRCVRTGPEECDAIFALTPGERYVFSTAPLRIDSPQDHIVWANHRPVPVFEEFRPDFEATVFVQSAAPHAAYGDGGSYRKIDENLDVAYARARPVPDSRSLPNDQLQTITITPQRADVRVNACIGVPDRTYVFGAVLFDPVRWDNIPFEPTPDFPSISQYATRYRAGHPEPCMLVTSEDRTVILKGYNFLSGEAFSGSLDAFSQDPAVLTPDATYLVQHYIPDPRGDGNPDGDYMTFGLLRDAPDRLHWKVNSRGLVGSGQRVSSWEFVFLFRTTAGGAEDTLRVTVTCNAHGNGACELGPVSPDKWTGMALSNPNTTDEFGRVDPVTGVGYLQVVLDVADVHSARLRAWTIDNRSADERPGDFIPNPGLTAAYLNIFDGFAHWTRADDLRRGQSRSMHIPF